MYYLKSHLTHSNFGALEYIWSYVDTLYVEYYPLDLSWTRYKISYKGVSMKIVKSGTNSTGSADILLPYSVFYRESVKGSPSTNFGYEAMFYCRCPYWYTPYYFDSLGGINAVSSLLLLDFLNAAIPPGSASI